MSFHFQMSRENASAENVGHIKDSAEPVKQSAEKVIVLLILLRNNSNNNNISLVIPLFSEFFFTS